eukprot:5769602-Pyramimonas_sp.AAC.1
MPQTLITRILQLHIKLLSHASQLPSQLETVSLKNICLASSLRALVNTNYAELCRSAFRYTLSPHRIGPLPEYIPSRLTGWVPALSIYPLASPDGSPP